MTALLNAQNCLSFTSGHDDARRCKNLEEAISIIYCVRGYSVSFLHATEKMLRVQIHVEISNFLFNYLFLEGFIYKFLLNSIFCNSIFQ